MTSPPWTTLDASKVGRQTPTRTSSRFTPKTTKFLIRGCEESRRGPWTRPRLSKVSMVLRATPGPPDAAARAALADAHQQTARDAAPAVEEEA